MFRKILIANRGEIACRAAQAAQELGIPAVAVFSDPDRHAPHVAAADEAYPLHGASAAETYLRIEKIIDIAKECGAEAVHPGYGFLSENPAFARACEAAGLTFIGPGPDVIEAMGDKIRAKQLMERAGVPVVPGWSSDVSPEGDEVQRAARDIGFPLLVKAAAGGGGKGMRVVREPSDLTAAVEAAGREAKAAFGDNRVFLEKFIERPRHVEIQIFGDSQGHAVHLFERECSLQRRHQKIIEEAPSPAISEELRTRMGEAAARAAKAIGYTNAGTVEFMVDDDANFYFLEVNARLQVEHPVTELTTLQDLVKAQLLVAAGEPLPFSPELAQSGHAIECRIYAEDPSRGFMPSVGRIEHYEPPSGAGIRVDSGVTRGSEVTVHYDPMLAKLIVWAPDRTAAIERLKWALRRFVVLGVTTNIEFLAHLVSQPFFAAGDFHTQLLDESPLAVPTDTASLTNAAIAAALSSGPSASSVRSSEHGDARSRVTPWAHGAWRMAQ